MDFLSNDMARLKANEYGSFLYNVLERLLASERTEKDLCHAEFALKHVKTNIKRMYKNEIKKSLTEAMRRTGDRLDGVEPDPS